MVTFSLQFRFEGGGLGTYGGGGVTSFENLDPPLNNILATRLAAMMTQ